MRPTLFGVSVDPITMEETVAACRRLIAEERPVQHVVLNAGKVVLMADDPELRDIVGSCAIVNADGQSVVWAGRLAGVRFPERVAGIDLMGELLAAAEVDETPVFFLGAREEVLLEFERFVRSSYPNLIIAGGRNGYFEDEREVAECVRSSGARLLFTAMPSPMKERFLYANLENMGPVLAVGVGGSFDVWAGVTRRAPVWMQRCGLEWFYRFAQEPGRMWRRYLLGNSRFAWLSAKEIVGRRLGAPPRQD